MYEYDCKVVKVIDGVTIDVLIDLGFGIWKKERCRLARVKTPEKNTPEGKVTFNRFIDQIMYDNVYKIKVIKREKYGRSLVELWDSFEENFSDWLLREGLAKEYNGGKRE